MEKKVTTYWYVYTNHDHTNKVISNLIPQEPENVNDNVICFDGVGRPLRECKWSIIETLRKNKGSMGLDFKVYQKVGKNGLVKEFTFF